MKIAVLGATGLTGQEVLRAAAERGIAATAILRDPARLGAPADRVVALPDVTDVAALSAAIDGCDAVMVTVGINRRTRSPWAPLVSPADTCTRTVQALVAAMAAPGAPKRVVYLSTFGAAEQWAKLPLPLRALIATSNIRVGYRDHAGAEAQLRASALDWTIVRPTALSEGPERNWVEAGPRASVLTKIPRAAVAQALLAALAPDMRGRVLPVTAPRR